MRTELDQGKPMDRSEILIRVFEQLRGEIVSMQRVRAQLYVFKVSALGVIFYAAARSPATEDAISPEGITALALAPIIAAAIDFFIEGHSFAIKEIGHYIRTQIEPILFKLKGLKDPFWRPFIPYEAFLVTPHGKVPKSRRQATKLLTWLSLAVSMLGLTPFGFFGYHLCLPPTLFFLWLIVAISLVLAAFHRYTVPPEWTAVVGSPEKPVLVSGRYESRCDKCGDSIIKMMERGEHFPEIKGEHECRTVAWLTLIPGMDWIRKWLANRRLSTTASGVGDGARRWVLGSNEDPSSDT